MTNNVIKACCCFSDFQLVYLVRNCNLDLLGMTKPVPSLKTGRAHTHARLSHCDVIATGKDQTRSEEMIYLLVEVEHNLLVTKFK